VPNIGPIELIIVLVIVLVIFGPKRLPGLGRSLGSAMREFKDSIGGKSDDDTQHLDSSTEASARPATDPPREPAKTAAVEGDAAGKRRP
jgi:sec-independent protein translocase protein TatA